MSKFKNYDKNEVIRVIVKEYGEILEGRTCDVENVYKENYDSSDIKIISKKEILEAYNKINDNIQILKDSGYIVSGIEKELYELYQENIKEEEI